jgi:membrane protein DedA with SNARE-associated domain
MDLWVSFWSALTSIVPDSGLMAVAGIVLLRSAAVPIPIPADLLVVMVGVEARETQTPLWPAWLVLSAATTIGAGLLYAFARWIGQGDIVHYGHYVGLTAARLDSAEAELDARGARAVLLARIIPGLRAAIVAVCGVVRFKWWKFVAAVILGALIYVGACLAVGYFFGASVVELLGQLVFPLGLVEPLIGITVLLFWLVRARRALARSANRRQPLDQSNRVRSGALAGAIAIAGSSMLVNVLIYLGGPFAAALLAATRTTEALVTFSGGLGSILLTILGIVVVGTTWGSMYAVVDMRWGATWPDWLRGLSLAAIPFAVALVLELIATLVRNQPLSAWLVEGIGEAIRWGTYGVLLGLIYPVFRTRRARKVADRQATVQPTALVESPVE